MSIKAKFAGTCRACGGHFEAGTDINWTKGEGSRHVKCPGTVVKSSKPLNSPGRAALQGRGKSDFFLGEKSETVLHYTMDGKPDNSDLGRVRHTKGDRWLKVIGIAAHWVSQDEADDFDLVHGGFERHWSVTEYYVPATEAEIAPVRDREKIKINTAHLEKMCDYEGEWAHDGYSGKLKPEIDAEATDRVCIWKKTVGYSLHQAWRTSIGIISFHPVYDDSPTWKLIRWEAMKPEDAELVKAASEVK